MKEKIKFPGRVRLNCRICGKEFSTHSSNRKECHKCKPKCRETHYFIRNKKEIKNNLENKETI